jgi:hypothetical protein
LETANDGVAAAAARLPMGKLGQASEIAEFVHSLVSRLGDRLGQNVLGCYD